MEYLPHPPGTLGLTSTQLSWNVVARLVSKRVAGGQIASTGQRGVSRTESHQTDHQNAADRLIQGTRIGYMDRSPPLKIFAQSHDPSGKPWWERRVNRDREKRKQSETSFFKTFFEEKKKKQPCMCTYVCVYNIHDCFFWT